MPSKKIKLHLGCGSVYLKGWVNIDRRDLDVIGPDDSRWEKYKEQNTTTIKKYYKRKYIKSYSATRKIVADRKFDIRHLGWKIEKGTVSEILAVQVLEHIPKMNVDEFIRSCYKILKPRGEIYMDVPDIIPTVAMAYNAKDDYKELEYALRLIYGSGKSEGHIHHDGYFVEKIVDMFKRVGFKNICVCNKIPHKYPTIGISATK